MKKAEDLKNGQKVRFDKEKYYYQVREVRHPFVICTQKLFGENYYTILDIENNIRGSGTNWGFGYITDADIAKSMLALHGEDPEEYVLEISRRNRVPIVITDVLEPK
jgi:hypothetical protein